MRHRLSGLSTYGLNGLRQEDELPALIFTIVGQKPAKSVYCRLARGITLLLVPGKAFACILLTRVEDRLVQFNRAD